MKVLITGAKGFVGKNLVAELSQNKEIEIYSYDIDTDETELARFTQDCDFVFHLAGVNRPKDPAEFLKGNFGFTSTLLDYLKKSGNTCPILMTSSTQAELDNPYGKSKKEGENLLLNYGKETGAKVYVYRLPNVFGKWCRPNYNSAVATFCHNISRDLPITVTDPKIELTLVYIDDVVCELKAALAGNANTEADGYCRVPIFHKATLGHITDLLYKFKESRKTLSVPDMNDAFEKKLYSTYLSALPTDDFSYNLKMNVDNRGSFTEIIRTVGQGQFSVNISKPGIIKGNHWHHTKNEKFLVVKGNGVIRFRDINGGEIIEYFVSDEKLEVVDIPPGYTHNIENLGDTDMVTFMWANEPFDPANPDTYFLEV
ncbi:MAG: capsular polysaccharide biosynthesis protein CapF [Ruminococcaceae bacterium]|nr:capsular polysaccharide biosynthesis protein CapF [Oscillospiraceae bacterium]